MDGYAQDAERTNVERNPLSIFANVPKAPKDPMFGLSAAYRADTFEHKVDLGVGAYRDGQAKPWIFNSVAKAKTLLHNDKSLNHEYLPIAGLPDFLLASQRLLFGRDSQVLRHDRVASVQTLSGTGALRLAADFLQSFVEPSPTKRVYVSQPPYINHIPILDSARLDTGTYPYYDPTSRSVNIEAMLGTLETLPAGSVVLLHACAHNPTGTDLSPAEWNMVAAVMEAKRHLPFFDCAYQGFATGDVDADAWPIRHFADRDFDGVIIAQSYAKNFGLYGERVGCLHMVLPCRSLAQNVHGQLLKMQRVNVSTPPAYGARIVSLILNDEGLRSEWLRDIRTVSDRMTRMRHNFRASLKAHGAAGSWEHITRQVGMFTYAGLSEAEVERLRDIYHIYTTQDGRISVAGLNDGNVEYVARAFAAVRSRAKL